jgi:hypothetical protein
MTMPPDDTKAILIAVPLKDATISVYVALSVVRGMSTIWSLSGGKRTQRGHRETVANDPKPDFRFAPQTMNPFPPTLDQAAQMQ